METGVVGEPRHWWVFKFRANDDGSEVVTLRADEHGAPIHVHVGPLELSTHYRLIRENPTGCIVWRDGKTLVKER